MVKCLLYDAREMRMVEVISDSGVYMEFGIVRAGFNYYFPLGPVTVEARKDIPNES